MNLIQPIPAHDRCIHAVSSLSFSTVKVLALNLQARSKKGVLQPDALALHLTHHSLIQWHNIFFHKDQS